MNYFDLPITAKLVMQFIKVEAKYVHFIHMGTPIVVDDIEVIALEANQ